MKNYEEIANAVFKRRDAYIAKQKKERKIVIATVTPMFVCCIALVVGFVLWQGERFKSLFPQVENPQETFTETTTTATDTTTKQTTKKPTESTQSPKTDSSKTTKDAVVTPPTQNTPSTTAPDVSTDTDGAFVIDSIDKMNFYSAKKIISEHSQFPIRMQSALSSPPIALMSNTYAEYPISRYKEFTTTMVTYFNIVLHSPKGFLAQKLGGIGRVEVVVTQNNIDDMGLMITFRRRENYYTCFANNVSYDPQTQTMISCAFSSHKYIDGFRLIKNLEQENYMFTVSYDGANVVGFETNTFHSTPSKYEIDDITFVPDFCVVLFTRQNFTIDQLETYFGNRKEEELV